MPTVYPVVFVPISPTAKALCGTAWSASILSPKKQIPYFEEQAKAWRKKAEKFKEQHNGSQFLRDCGSVPADHSKNTERGTRVMKRELPPALIQKSICVCQTSCTRSDSRLTRYKRTKDDNQNASG